MLRMLAGCEWSGRVRDAFLARGWDAWSCDLLPGEGDHPERHIQADIQVAFDEGGWNLIILFPECRHLSRAGAVWWKQKRLPRYDEDGNELPSLQDEAAAFFMRMVKAPAPHVAVENPLGDMSQRYRPPDQVVEPWWFGDMFAKKTGLWLKDLPRLYADDMVPPASRAATGGGSWRTDLTAGRSLMSAYEDSEGRARRALVRGRTFPGFARAMGAQWGAFIEAEGREVVPDVETQRR